MPTSLERFFEAAGCKTQTELAEFLGIRQSSIADAKRRNRIPAEWLLTLWRKKGVNPDWILTGQGFRQLQPAESEKIKYPPTVYVTEIRPPEECSVEQLVVELTRRSLLKIHLPGSNE